MARLATYRAKRDFGKTPEPRGAANRAKGNEYVIQKHAATRLHYDLRLELDGVMKSWAVTRGPSLIPTDKRLAVHVEDHPVEYNTFEGTIPKGEYGGGTVMIWDRGRWIPEGDPHAGMKKGHLEFRIDGKKLKGLWHLVRMKPRPGERQEPWLLIKAEDEFARTPSQPDVLKEEPQSAATGRTMEEIAADKKKVWHSNKPATAGKAASVVPSPKARAASRAAKPASRTARAAKSGSRTARRKAGNAKDEPDASGIPGARKAALAPFARPSLATLSARPPDSDDWVHEIKFDGYRMQMRIEGEKVTLKTRTALDWTHKFPSIAEAALALTPCDVILDGEIVSIDDKGISNFSALQDDLKTGRHDRLVYYVFDLLHLNGYDLTGASLVDRKRALEQFLSALPRDGIIRYSEHFEIEGSRLLDHARRMHLEGIISKRHNEPYRSGRHDDWRKIKCSDSQELVVAGYGPSDVSPRRVAALVLGYYEGGKLQYAGRVGTGMTDAMRDDLWKRLQSLRVKTSPFGAVPEEERPRAVEWVEPKIVAEVDFRGWTGSGRVRQASLKGLRDDKPAKQVVREVQQVMPAAKPRQAALRQKAAAKSSPAQPRSAARIEFAGVTLSHPDRVYWEDVGVTKQMLAEYYEQVWDHMQPHVTGRVLALLRCPEGITGECFFQKHASAGIEADRLKLIREPNGKTSIAIEDLTGLISLVQAGALEVHLRGSRIDQLEHADRLVFDLDPGPGVEWSQVIDAAREVRARLRAIKLESFVKTTGGKGLHVVLPIRAAPWDEAKEFCRNIAGQMAADTPARYTATLKKAARDRRIFVDYLRNSREATAIAPYSTRARPGATVSVPLSWTELGKQEVSNAFNVGNLPKRLARMRTDPWQAMMKIRQRLPAS